MTWPVHPAAQLLRLLDGEEFDQLVDDIHRNGLLHPIVLWHGGDGQETVLLDGRNRLAACQAAGVAPTTTYFHGDAEAALNYVMSANVYRRQLEPGEKAAIAYSILPMFEEIAAKRKKASVSPRNGTDNLGTHGPQGSVDHDGEPKEQRAPQARDQAAAAVGISGRTVQRFKRIKRIKEADPDLADHVAHGKISIRQADKAVTRKKEAAKPARTRTPKPQPKPEPTPEQRTAEKAANQLHHRRITIDGILWDLASRLGDPTTSPATTPATSATASTNTSTQPTPGPPGSPPPGRKSVHDPARLCRKVTPEMAVRWLDGAAASAPFTSGPTTAIRGQPWPDHSGKARAGAPSMVRLARPAALSGDGGLRDTDPRRPGAGRARRGLALAGHLDDAGLDRR